MSLQSAVRLGSQLPRVRLAPRSPSNDVDDAVYLSTSYGLTPDEWQEDVLAGWLGIRRDGKWAAPRCGLAVPRQNGKNGIIEMRELHGMVTLGEKFLHTAHEVKTARKAYTRLVSFFENKRKYPELAELVAEIRKTNGQEAIVLTNGGSVEFIARSKGSGRGYTVDVLVLDEAQELSEEALAALLPTISAAPLGNPQTILTGTPPGPKMNGEVFTRTRTAGIKGTDRRLSWNEWSVESMPDDLSDKTIWAQVNPAAGTRLAFAAMADERELMDDETFSRERLGLWEEEGARNRVIPSEAWASCLDITSEIVSVPVFALDVSPNHSWSAVAVAGMRQDGLPHIEVTSSQGVVDHRPGTDWVVPRLVDLKARWPGMVLVIASGSAAESLVPALQAAGFELVFVKGNDVAAGCGLFYDLATTAGLRHLGQTELTTALSVARKAVEDGEGAWRWGRRKSSSDITPLYAATLALWAAVAALNTSMDPANNVW